MSSNVSIPFISLFVPDLEQARAAYARVFGTEAVPASGEVPPRHPFSPLPPAVFELGGVRLCLYQVDGRVTHAGDVGLGIATTDEPEAVLRRAAEAGGQVLMSPTRLPASGDGALTMSIFMLPDRHFFELVKREPAG